MQDASGQTELGRIRPRRPGLWQSRLWQTRLGRTNFAQTKLEESAAGRGGLKPAGFIGGARAAEFLSQAVRFPLGVFALALGIVLVGHAIEQFLFAEQAVPVLHLLKGPHDKDDSWGVIYRALDQFYRAPDQSIYQTLFFDQAVKFQYPPSSLLPFAALDALGLRASPVVLNEINRWVTLATAAGLGVLAWRAAPLWPRERRAAFAGLCVAGALAFSPIAGAYSLGQVQVWINALFVLACLAWQGGRRPAAGALIACICLLKPQFSLFVLWAAARRQWGFLAGLAVAGAAGMALSVLVFGLSNHFDYVSVLRFLSRHGEAFQGNDTFNGLLHRVTGNAFGWYFTPNTFPPFSPIVYAGTLVTAAALIGLALWPPPGRRAPRAGAAVKGGAPPAGLFDLQCAALAFTIASPIAWEHHYGVLAPMFVMALAALGGEAAGRSRMVWGGVLCAAFVLAASHTSAFVTLSGSPLAVLQSYRLFGGLALMALLWRLSRSEGCNALVPTAPQTAPSTNTAPQSSG